MILNYVPLLQACLQCCDRPTITVCLYGDGPAKSLGYEPLGLSHHAGLELARVSLKGR